MRISVIMPTYCQAAFIEDSIRSVLGQKGVDLELIIYDAISTDETASVLGRYRSDPRVTWFREPDRGQVDALNKGLNRAKGDLLCWLNSDDLFLPQALESILSVFATNQEVGFVYGDALELDEAGNILGPNPYTEEPDADRYLNSHNFICQPTCFFRRSLWEELRPIRSDMQWTFDYELFGRFFSSGFRGFRLGRFLAANRHYAETKTSQGLGKRYLEIARMVMTRSNCPLWEREAIVIYGLELLIKGLEQWNERDTGMRCSLARRFLPRLHLLFHGLVAPRDRESIDTRYQQEIVSKGWKHSHDWLKNMNQKARINA